MKITERKRLAIGALAATWLGLMTFCASVEPARAVTVYTYTGNDFSGIINDNFPPDGSYTSSMSVFGSFTLLNPLAPNLALTNIAVDVQNFSFFDGRNTITNLNANATTPIFAFSTDALGNIIQWTVQLVHFTDLPFDAGDQAWAIRSLNNSSDVLDFGQIAECLVGTGACSSSRVDNAIIRASPGTWSVSEVPLPGALPLFATGLGALGLLGWRRKRKAAVLKA
jgi:hypothetical protein